MLEYSKMILEKVSFDRTIFEKELSKAVKRVNAEEIAHLEGWIYAKFSEKHLKVIDSVFKDKRRAAYRRRVA